jgi:hypothetical protein
MRATIKVAFVPKTSAILYLDNFRASPFNPDLEGVSYKVPGEAKLIRKVCWGRISVSKYVDLATPSTYKGNQQLLYKTTLPLCLPSRLAARSK